MRRRRFAVSVGHEKKFATLRLLFIHKKKKSSCPEEQA